LEYLDGVIAFYRARTETRMMIAGERLAVIAVVTLPVTALASVLGMNLVEGARWNVVPLSIALLVMITMSTWLLRWARRKGWW
jgi:Mg2+ and Co2+ transporter CorA